MAPTGVAGMVSKAVLPKRQRLPTARPCSRSVLDKPDELSVSEAVADSPMSVVSSASSSISKASTALEPAATCAHVFFAPAFVGSNDKIALSTAD